MAQEIQENVLVNLDGATNQNVHDGPPQTDTLGDQYEHNSNDSTDSDEMTKKERFQRWFTNNFTNERHEEAMKQQKRKRQGSQEFAYFNDVILQMLRRVKDTTTEDQIMAVFQEFDANGDGVISEEEMAVVMERLLHIKLQDVELKKFFAKIDTDQNGKIEYTEFVNWVTGHSD